MTMKAAAKVDEQKRYEIQELLFNHGLTQALVGWSHLLRWFGHRH